MTIRPELLAAGPLPPRIARLPVDARGYPIPWFVDWLDGVPEFRAMDLLKWRQAIAQRRCWVCGDPLGQFLAFVVGPMCVINRTTAEPPCHRECAAWSAVHCPFLSRPHMVRRSDEDFPAGDAHMRSPGLPLARNPGVAVVYVTKSLTVFSPRTVTQQANAGLLIEMGDPLAIDWFACGRAATRVEVEQAILRGVPALFEMATQDRDPLGATRALDAAVARVREWLPPEVVRV